MVEYPYIYASEFRLWIWEGFSRNEIMIRVGLVRRNSDEVDEKCSMTLRSLRTILFSSYMHNSLSKDRNRKTQYDQARRCNLSSENSQTCRNET